MGAPEVSEAIYRLAQAAREERALAEEIRLSPAAGRARRLRLVSRAGAAAAAGRVRRRRCSGAFPTSPTSASATRTSSRSSSTRSTTSTTRRRASSRSSRTARSPLHERGRSPPGSTTTSPRSARAGLVLEGHGARRRFRDAARLRRRPRRARCAPRPFDIGHDAARRAGAAGAPLSPRSPSGWTASAAPRARSSSTAPRAEEGSADAQRAAEVRFARFFNNTPIAIATLARGGRILRANAPFVRLFGGDAARRARRRGAEPARPGGWSATARRSPARSRRPSSPAPPSRSRSWSPGRPSDRPGSGRAR